MRRRSALLLLLPLFSGCAAGPRPVTAPNAQPPPKPLELSSLKPQPLTFSPPEVRQARLSGGARVFLLEDHDVPLVRIFLSFRGGAVHDPAEKAGLAQVAGLAWRTGGTAARSPEAMDEALEGEGIELALSFGRDTGSASLSVLPREFERGLALFGELLKTPAFRQDRIDWATTRVAESLRRETDDPQALAFRELRRALYEGHPRGVMATRETLKRVSRDDIVALHRKVLESSAWTVGVVGDFRAEELLPKLERELGSLPGDGGAFPAVSAPPAPKTRIVLVPKAVPQSTVVWARFGPPRTAPDFYPLGIADYLFGSGGFQCRLSREIRSNRGLAYSVGGFYEAQSGFGILGAYASTKKESTREVLELLRDLTTRSAREGFTADEVSSAKEALNNRHVFRYQDPADLVKGQMSLSLDGLPLDLPSRYLKEMQAQSAATVSRVSGEYYGPGPHVIVVVGDVDPADPAWQAEGAAVTVARP